MRGGPAPAIAGSSVGTKRGCQFGSASVAGLPSRYASRIAVIGRQSGVVVFVVPAVDAGVCRRQVEHREQAGRVGEIELSARTFCLRATPFQTGAGWVFTNTAMWVCSGVRFVLRGRPAP